MRSAEAIKRARDNFNKRHPGYRRKYHYHYHRNSEKDKAYERRYRRIYLQHLRDTSPTYRAWKAEKDRMYRGTPKGKLRNLRTRIKRRGYNDRGTFTPQEWQVTLEEFGNACAYCGNRLELTIDHFLPLSSNGMNVIGNLVPSCRHCNSSKQGKLPQDWCHPDKLTAIIASLNRIMDFTRSTVLAR